MARLTQERIESIGSTTSSWKAKQFVELFVGGENHALDSTAGTQFN
jgi:hypothetical protein